MRRLIVMVGTIGLLGCSGGKDGEGPATSAGAPGGGQSGTPGGTLVLPPQAQDDIASVSEGGNVVVNVASNDLVQTNPLALGSVTVVDPPQFGTVVVNADGTTSYTHDGGETTGDSFTYTIEDSAGVPSNVASVVLDVTPVNDAPVAVDDAGAGDQGTSFPIDVGGNDSDVDDGIALNSIVITVPATYATVVPNPDGTVSYQHDGSSVPYDQFRYTIEDASGEVSNEAVVDVTIYTTNVPPLAVEDFFFVDEGSSINLDFAVNDIDVDDGLDLASIEIVTYPLYGTVTVLGDGTVDYTHDGSENPADSIIYTIRDLGGAVSNPASAQLSLIGVNDPPVANDDAGNVTENLSVNVPVLDNDVDVDDGLDPATVAVVTAPQYGTVMVLADGSIDYQHDGSQVYADSFTYTVDDYSGATTSPATVNLVVTLVNDPPLAVDDADLVAEGGALIVDLAGNDSDSDDPLDLTSIQIVSGPSNGSITVLLDGSVDYQHDGSETTSDSFSYTIDDQGGNTSNVATVNVTVTPVNDPPVAVNDQGSTIEGIGTTIPVLGNDVDVDDGLDSNTVVVESPPSNGTAVVLANGSIEYTHDGSETINDSFEYSVRDTSGAISNVATVDVTVSPLNDPPVANNDSGFVVVEGATAILDLQANDTDPDDGIDPTSLVVLSGPSNGSAVLLPDGTVEYSHDGGESLSDNFVYQVTDFAGLASNSATVNLTVTPVNDPPLTVADAGSVDEGGGIVLVVLVNDVDVDDGLDVSSVAIETAPSNGVVAVNPDGTIDYQHDGSETISDSFAYSVRDFTGAPSNTSTVAITVTPVNDPPVTSDDTGNVVDEGSMVTITVLANDSDLDDGINASTVSVVSSPSRGSAVVLADGRVQYTHDGSETTADNFSYQVSDFAGASSNVSSIQVTVNPVNDPPVANDDSAAVDEGALANLSVLGNDSDVDSAIEPSSVQIVSAPTRGVATPLVGGAVSYTHDGSESTSDSFTYTVQDVNGAVSNVATMNLTINPINDPPVATDDEAQVNEGAGATIDLVGNDTDPEGNLEPASIQITSGPSNGTVVNRGDGSVDYVHDGSETFGDLFQYRVQDSLGLNSNIATVSISVNPVNDPPVAVDDGGGVTFAGLSTNIDLAANDYDVDSALDLGSITIVAPASQAVVVPNGDGTVQYTHTGAPGVDSFAYVIRDVDGASSNVAVVVVDVVCAPFDMFFPFTGAEDVFEVPTGCEGRVVLDVAAAQGSGGNGGNGATASGTYPVGGGEQFTVRVGGQAGFNGGGLGFGGTLWSPTPPTGGGATDIRYPGTSTFDRIIVAGGGGGSGGDANYLGGGGGAGVCEYGFCGGGGGLGWGGVGSDGDVQGGAGFTTAEHAGGAGGGGAESGGGGSCQSYSGNSCGFAGSHGAGGSYEIGGGVSYPVCVDRGIAGGGGGFFGGGGVTTGFCGSGGGGGGSSLLGPVAQAVHDAATNVGDGYAAIRFEPVESGYSLVGSYDLASAPPYAGNPPALSCAEACTNLFGPGVYVCSTSPNGVNHMAWGTGYAVPGCQAMGTNESFDASGTGYSCGRWGCAYSAYVNDNCAGRVNYCYQ